MMMEDMYSDIINKTGSDGSIESLTDTLKSVQHQEDHQDQEEEDSDEDDEIDSVIMNQMRLLLEKAKLSARNKTLIQSKTDQLKDQSELVLFGQEDEVEDEQHLEQNSNPLPSGSKSAIARSLVKPVHLSQPKLDKKGKGRATTQDVTLAQDLRGLITTQDHKSEQGDNWGQPLSQQLSKKERKAKQIPTAGPKWFNMPAQTMTPELKREIQAMRLRNALDPKRFYKGGAKNDKTMPEFFQLGHILPSTSSASTAPASIARKRTFVEELVDDEQAKAYTKRKFTSEVMVKGMSGRGNKGKRGGKGGREKGRGGKGRS